MAHNWDKFNQSQKHVTISRLAPVHGEEIAKGLHEKYSHKPASVQESQKPEPPKQPETRDK